MLFATILYIGCEKNETVITDTYLLGDSVKFSVDLNAEYLYVSVDELYLVKKKGIKDTLILKLYSKSLLEYNRKFTTFYIIEGSKTITITHVSPVSTIGCNLLFSNENEKKKCINFINSKIK